LLAGRLSHCPREGDDPLARKLSSLIQFFIGCRPAAMRMVASVTTLFKRLDVRENPEAAPVAFADI
jgi:hypothetical protein